MKELITTTTNHISAVCRRCQKYRSMKKYTWVICLLVALVSCRKEEALNFEQPLGLGGDTWQFTAVDQWLHDSLTVPYNIAVKYRWDPWELNLDKTLTPPDESRIIPAMSAIKRVWIDPYNQETGSDLFIKRYSPKQFKLVGSVEYNYNGTVVLGQAEGGNNIAFFDINQHFDRDEASAVRRMIQTTHHEFAHILHQTVLYPPEFKGISAGLGLKGYTATWFNISEAEALENGYITPYSMASYDEDFVEMVANMLMEGRSRFDELVAARDETARSALRSKERIVVDYFKNVWEIDFYSLQTRVQAALNSLVTPPAVNDLFGFDKTYTTASADMTDPVGLPQPAAFRAMFESAVTAVSELPGNYQLDSFSVMDNDASTTYLLFYLVQDGAPTLAVFGYDQSRTPGGLRSYSIFGSNQEGADIEDAVLPLLAYFQNNQFNITWYADPLVTIYPRVRFTPVSNPGNYFLAKLYP